MVGTRDGVKRAEAFLCLPESWLALSRKSIEKRKRKKITELPRNKNKEEKIEINTCVKKWSMCVIFIMNALKSRALVVRSL